MRNFMADSDRQPQDIPAYIIIPAALGVILFLAWVLNHALEQQKRADHSGDAKSHLQTHNIAQAIETRIKAQKRITLTFALEHKHLLEHILSNPDDFSAVEYYRTLLKTYLPSLFAFSLYDTRNHAFILQDPEFEGKIDNLCAQDTQRYTSEHHLNLRIHPNPIQYHYDLYHSIQLHNKPYILFTCFRREPLVQLLKQAEIPGHRLYLIRHTPQGELIELSAKGDRKALLTNHLRTQTYLTPEEVEQIKGRTPVPCSEWEVVDLIDPSHIQTMITQFQAHLQPFVYLTILISGLFLVFLWFCSQKEELFVKTIQDLNQELKAQAAVSL